MTLELKKCSLDDLKALQSISIETFTDTFKDQNTEKDLNDYIQNVYNEAQLKKELLNQNSYFFFLHNHAEVVGYLKLNVGSAQSEDTAPNALEIERIYIRKSHKRNGYGKLLVEKSENVARELSKDAIWLGVWEHNPNAIAFYEKMGFTQTGSHSFFMGDDEQTDLIMTKKVR